MKKAGIITINDFNNYGNRLQNYALQKVIENLGMKVETILNHSLPIEKSKIKALIKRCSIKLINLLKGKQKSIMLREKNFKIFNDRYMRNTPETIYMDKINYNFHEQYDYIVIGSDQVWNYNFKRIPKIDFALFSPKEKNISYAASFGVDYIEEEWKSIYQQGLSNIQNISVREEKGAEIVKELINKEVFIALDPTLLLTKEEWNIVQHKPNVKINKPFILTYFLGEYDKNRKEELIKFANKYRLEIIDLGKLQYKKYYTAGPSEFLWYIQNAEIIFTDSFHASVFSIIFNKTFYVLEREDSIKSMNSRLDTLLSKFKLQEQKFKSWKKIKLEHNYSNAYEILKKERKKSIEFLKNALNI